MRSVQLLHGVSTPLGEDGQGLHPARRRRLPENALLPATDADVPEQEGRSVRRGCGRTHRAGRLCLPDVVPTRRAIRVVRLWRVLLGYVDCNDFARSRKVSTVGNDRDRRMCKGIRVTTQNLLGITIGDAQRVERKLRRAIPK